MGEVEVPVLRRILVPARRAPMRLLPQQARRLAESQGAMRGVAELAVLVRDRQRSA